MANRPRARLLTANYWLLSGRLVLALFSLFLSLIVTSDPGKTRMLASVWPIKWVFLTGIAYLVLDLVYLVLTRWTKDLSLFLTRSQAFLAWQLAGDLALAGMFLYLTGGVASPFYFLLLTVVMAAGMALSWRRAFSFCVAAVFIVWLVSALYAGAWGMPGLQPPRLMELWATSLGRSAGLLAVGLLTIILNWRLQTVRLVSGEILESAGEGMLAVDGKGRVMFENEEFRSLFGIEARAEGEYISNVLLRPEDSWLLEAIRLNQASRTEKQLLHRLQNKEIPVRVVLLPLGGENGRGMVARFEDMSVEKRLEEAERRTEQYRLAADTARSIAHEVRNPLASLNIAIQELVRGFDVPKNRKDLVNVIGYEVTRIDRIVDEFMTLSRIRPPEARLVAVRGVIEEAVSLLDRTEEAVSKKITVEIDAPFDLTIRLDADHLRQILLNLGLNSLQAGADHVTITACSTDPTGPATIEVADDGPGMPKEVLDRIFEPFFTTRTRGAGVGCAVVRKMVEDHGGSVEVESMPGKGTVFRINFPSGAPAKEKGDATEEA